MTNPDLSLVTDQTADPAPNPVNIARERGETLVKNISSHTLTELSALRDQIDGLMHAVRARETAVIAAIGDLAQDAAGAIEMKQIIAESIASLQKQLQPAPPVITQ